MKTATTNTIETAEAPGTTARLRPHERIKSPGDFRRAFQRRRPESDGPLLVHATANGLGHSRLGISVSKKHVRSAVARNRLKRLVREAFRLSKAELPIGLDLVVVPRARRPELALVRRSLVDLARRLDRKMTRPPAALDADKNPRAHQP